MMKAKRDETPNWMVPPGYRPKFRYFQTTEMEPPAVYSDIGLTVERCWVGMRGIVKEATFVPQKAARRFMALMVTWAPYMDSRAVGNMKKREASRAWKRYRAECAAYPRPTSYVDVPSRGIQMEDCETGMRDPMVELLTFSQALKRAAARNVECLAKLGVPDATPHYGDDLWAIVVERGEPNVAIFNWETGRDGLIMETADVRTPLRVYYPTAAELKRHRIAGDRKEVRHG